MERLHRIVEFSAEVSHNGSGTLHRLAIPTTAADPTDKDLEVGSPTERLALGDHSPLHKTFAPDQMAERAPSVTSQEKWQQHCSDTMRQLAQRILDPQLLAHMQANPAKEVQSRSSSMSRPSRGSLASRSSRPAEVWEGLAHLLGIGVKLPEAPEFTNNSAPAVRIDAPLVKPPPSRTSHHHHHHHLHKSIEQQSLQEAQEQQEQQEQSQRVSLVQQMLEEALMATAKKDEQVVEQHEDLSARSSGAANAPVPGHVAPTAPMDMGPPASGGSAFRWAPQGRASRKHNRLLGARSLDNDYRPSNLLRRPACFSHQEVTARDDKSHVPQGPAQPTCPCGTSSAAAAIDAGTQLHCSTSSPCSHLPITPQAQASVAMDVGLLLDPSNIEGRSGQEEEEDCSSFDGMECVSRSWPTSTNTHLPKNPTTTTTTTTTPLKHLDQSCKHHFSRVSSHAQSMVAHASADANQSRIHSQDCSPSGVGQVQQLPRSFSHTRTLGFGSEQSRARVHSDGSAVAIGAVHDARASQLPSHPVHAGTLPPLKQPSSGDELPWDASTTPVRAFEGNAYEWHLRALLAQQTSPSAAQERRRQHLRELLSGHLASPAAKRAPGCVPAGVYDSCTSAKEAGCLGDNSSCNSSTCFATPELHVQTAWERRSDGCVGDEEPLYHQTVCTHSQLPQDQQQQQQQESSHHHQSASDYPGGHPSSSQPLPHPPPAHLRNSSSTQGLGETGEMKETAMTPLSLRHQHSHSSTGSLPIFATPSAAFSSNTAGGSSGSFGRLSSPARPPLPNRTPVRGALTKRLQQALPHHSATSTPLATKGALEGQQHQQLKVSKPACPGSQDVLAALQRHQHTRSDASFHTAVEGGEEEVEGVVEGARRAAGAPWVDGGEQLGERGGEDLGCSAAQVADEQACAKGSISLSQQQQQQQQPLEVREDGCLVRQNSASLYPLPRVDTPPALPTLPHRLSGSGCSESSVTSSGALGKTSERKGRGGISRGQSELPGLDASQFSSLAVLDTLYNAPLVHPGDCLHFSLGGINTLAYWRPLLPRRAHILGPMHQLASYADEELATELSGWAAAALIRHGLLMPITPSSMACFLEAPVPFVLGWQYKTHDVSTRCTSLVRVNVYKGNVSNASHLPALPGQKKLAAALAPHHARVRTAGAAAGASSRPVHVLTPEEEQATKSFLDVLSSHLGGCSSSSGCANSGSDACLLGDLRPYFITNVSGNTRTATLMKDWVIEGTPSRDRPFVRAFLETQMFQVHSDRIMASMCEGRVV
ncbi:hypothetical protein DUNSADRAFT_1640 [Dunaliella salina]|uniref:Uncharacterized protein n=1 Tax=Dunaliella salina TaxID=3046 RepID=A0ABQ7GWX1_DUNSA|nr:hypothetical protein DUNSADRAFT_1640 [Dunaliella salina]|eukprot:KAF5839095.1 hypothetical protein DUNSADRAFT_1640 [Dunaliella salina]